jgi:hypothetical protein
MFLWDISSNGTGTRLARTACSRWSTTQGSVSHGSGKKVRPWCQSVSYDMAGSAAKKDIFTHSRLFQCFADRYFNVGLYVIWDIGLGPAYSNWADTKAVLLQISK